MITRDPKPRIYAAVSYCHPSLNTLRLQLRPQGVVMNKLIAGLAILAPFVAAGAQDFSRADVFGGYSLERIAVCGHTNNACGVESGDLPPTMNLSGWEVA